MGGDKESSDGSVSVGSMLPYLHSYSTQMTARQIIRFSEGK